MILQIHYINQLTNIKLIQIKLRTLQLYLKDLSTRCYDTRSLFVAIFVWQHHREMVWERQRYGDRVSFHYYHFSID